MSPGVLGTGDNNSDTAIAATAFTRTTVNELNTLPYFNPNQFALFTTAPTPQLPLEVNLSTLYGDKQFLRNFGPGGASAVSIPYALPSNPVEAPPTSAANSLANTSFNRLFFPAVFRSSPYITAAAAPVLPKSTTFHLPLTPSVIMNGTQPSSAPAAPTSATPQANVVAASGRVAFTDEDITILAQKLLMSEALVRDRLQDPTRFRCFRVKDMEEICKYLRDHKGMHNLRLGSGLKETKAQSLCLVLFSHSVNNTPTASNQQPPPSLPAQPARPQSNNVTRASYIKPMMGVYKLSVVDERSAATEQQLLSFHRILHPTATISGHAFRWKSTMFTHNLQVDVKNPSLQIRIEVPVRSLLPLMTDEICFNASDISKAAHLFLYNEQGLSDVVISPKAGYTFQMTIDNVSVHPKLDELVAGLKNVDITKYLPLHKIHQAIIGNNSQATVCIALTINRSVLSRGFLAICCMRKVPIDEMACSVYISTINAAMRADEVPHTMRSDCSAVEELASAERVFEERLMDRHQESSSGGRKGQLKDSDIEIADQVLSLRCPLGLVRITHPAKGRNCTHRECFDLATFLQVHEKRPTWKCAVCSDKIDFSLLRIDPGFKSYLKLYPDSDRCIVHSDGTTSPFSAGGNDSSTSATDAPASPVRASPVTQRRRGGGEGAWKRDAVIDLDSDAEEKGGSGSMKRTSSTPGASPATKRRLTSGFGREEVVQGRSVIVLDDD